MFKLNHSLQNSTNFILKKHSTNTDDVQFPFNWNNHKRAMNDWQTNEKDSVDLMIGLFCAAPCVMKNLDMILLSYFTSILNLNEKFARYRGKSFQQGTVYSSTKAKKVVIIAFSVHRAYGLLSTSSLVSISTIVLQKKAHCHYKA